MDYEAIGARVRMLRQERRMTQETLAEAADISPVYVSQVEHGVRHARLETLERIAAALGATLDMLMQSDVPDAALHALLNDCTEVERQVILDVIAAVKRSLQKNFPAP